MFRNLLGLGLFISMLSLESQGAKVLRVLAVDFDDTLMFTNSKVYIYDTLRDLEVPLTTQEFAEIRPQFGQKEGSFSHYEIRDPDESGSYREFRDHPHENRILAAIHSTLKERPESRWQGPVWSIIAEALNDPDQAQRIAIITARGHEPKNFEKAFHFLVDQGYFQYAPEAKNIFPVSSPEWRKKNFSTERAKVEALSILLDQLEHEVLLRRQEGEDVLGSLVFMDDDRKNFESATSILPTILHHWPHVEVFVSFVGMHQEDLSPVTLRVEATPPSKSLCLQSLKHGPGI